MAGRRAANKIHDNIRHFPTTGRLTFDDGDSPMTALLKRKAPLPIGRRLTKSLHNIIRNVPRLVGVRCIPVPEYMRARKEAREDIQQAFYLGLRVRNGVTKMTQPHRMDDVLPLLVQRASLVEQRPLRILDVACSSGVSTAEMHQALAQSGLHCETVGTDLVLYSDYVTHEDGTAILFDKDRNVLQIEIGSWASPRKLRRRDLILRPHLCFRAKRLANRDADRFRRALDGPSAGFHVTRIPLLAAGVDSSHGIRFQEEDIWRPCVPGLFGIIRAANILNLAYFSPAEIRSLARLLVGRLIPGGLLLVVRTETALNTNRATLFRYREGHLSVETHLNGGSEVAHLLTSVTT